MSRTFRNVLEAKIKLWWSKYDYLLHAHRTRDQWVEYDHLREQEVYGDGLPHWWRKEHVRRSRHHTKQALHTRQLNRIEPYSKDNWWD